MQTCQDHQIMVDDPQHLFYMNIETDTSCTEARTTADSGLECIRYIERFDVFT